MKYELLNNISAASLLLNVTFAFTMVFEPRCSRKAYLSSMVPFLVLLLGSNFYVIFRYGFPIYARYTAILATLPSLLYFYLVSQHRDGRFFFTFCLVDTSSIWLALATGLTDYAIGAEGLFNFFVRLAVMPLSLYIIYRWLRQPFLQLLHTVDRGWWLFTATTGLVYAILLTIGAAPVSIRERPEDMPFVFMLLLFLPLTYATIFYVLFSQQKLYDLRTQERTYAIQSTMIQSKARQIQEAAERVRIERHDLRHRLNLITELARSGDQEQLLKYLGSVQQSLTDTAPVRYCTNPILDAILTACFQQAQDAGIALETHLSIPEDLPVPPEELATVFANALENAVQACSRLPVSQRKLTCTCIQKPTLMLEVRNTYQPPVHFDTQGYPLSHAPGHGIGTHSIAAFCLKHKATCIYDADGTWFRLMISL